MKKLMNEVNPSYPNQNENVVIPSSFDVSSVHQPTCISVLCSGKSKGSQCKTRSIKGSVFCTRHNNMFGSMGLNV